MSDHLILELVYDDDEGKFVFWDLHAIPFLCRPLRIFVGSY